MHTMQLLFAIGVIASIVGLGTTQNCRPTQFECNSGQCIPAYYVCDGVKDCGDGSDEPPMINPELCPACDDEQFNCENGVCIPSGWVCDGDNDCADASDERQDCPPCSNVQFTREIGGCIPESFLCNRENNCVDWSDETEENCPCTADETRCNAVPAPPGEWQLPGVCMPSEFWCDEEGIRDCPDGSDESNCTTVNRNVLKETSIVRQIRQEFQKNALKVRKQQKQARKTNKPSKRFSNNPKHWHMWGKKKYAVKMH